jgi:hypothetical protein
VRTEEVEEKKLSAAEELREILKAKVPDEQPVVFDEEARSAEKLKKYLIKRRGSSSQK